MKIEIGESAIYSWLRHVKKCAITQLNWKISPKWEQNIPTELNDLYDAFNLEFDNPFKKNRGLDQAIKQAEIDVLGVNLSENIIYAIDTAFHKNGINYGSKEETAKRVIKKLFRSIIIAKVYFPKFEHHIYFASPRITNSFAEILDSNIEKLITFLAKKSLNCNIQTIIGNDYVIQIQLELEKIAHEFHDSSELYIRSLQLNMLSNNVNLTHKNRHNIQPNSPNSVSEDITREINKVTRRVPGWFENPNQINSVILHTYLELFQNISDEITIEILKTEVISKNMGIDATKFTRNFTQMSHIAENNHGKVFDICNGYIILWEPIRDFIKKEYLRLK